MAMEKIEIKFWTIDDWGRPIFKSRSGTLYGSLDKLFPYGASKEEVLQTVNEKDITLFGSDIDDDPLGIRIADIRIDKN
jgi:hypothetical protein